MKTLTEESFYSVIKSKVEQRGAVARGAPSCRMAGRGRAGGGPRLVQRYRGEGGRRESSEAIGCRVSAVGGDRRKLRGDCEETVSRGFRSENFISHVIIIS